MTERRYRVLFVGSHPVQYAAPVFREMAQRGDLDIQVAYCSLQGAEPGVDAGFGVEVAWDVPLLEGYPWVRVANRSPWPGLGRFFGPFNPGLWNLVREREYDAVVIYTGYRCANFWIVAAAAKLSGVPLLFGTDAHELRSVDGRAWKKRLKQWLWPRLFRLADVVIVPSSTGAALMRSLGTEVERLVVTPYVVDNDWWTTQAARADPAAVRREWNVPESAAVALFCAKLQPWKRPHDVLQAFAKAGVPQAHLVYAGEGPLRGELEAEAKSLGIAASVRFLGFRNQSQLPAVYRAADLLVLPSEYEPFGVVVNEAMLCGCPVAVSDRVGAGYDLVSPGENGFAFPCGDVDALARIFRQILPERARLREMGEAARERMESWSPKQNVDSLVRALDLAGGARAPANTGATV